MLDTLLAIVWALVTTPIWGLVEALKAIFYLIAVFFYLIVSRFIPFVVTHAIPFTLYYICYPIFTIVFYMINHSLSVGGSILSFLLDLPIPSGIGKAVLLIIIGYAIVKLTSVEWIMQAFKPILRTLDLYFSPLLIPFQIAKSAFKFAYTVLSGGKKQEEGPIPEFQTEVQPAEQFIDRVRKRKISVARQEDNLCVVCLTNAKCMLIRPCNHACLCIDCAQLLTTESILRECPLCRGNVVSLERIYI